MYMVVVSSWRNNVWATPSDLQQEVEISSAMELQGVVARRFLFLHFLSFRVEGVATPV